MNRYILTTATFVAILFLTMPVISRERFADDVVKYVQGGACEPGLGTKKQPYTKLSQAEADTSWDVLIVLPSPIALDGGIDLRDGTKLIGENDPTSRITGELSIITNTSASTNGGNGVVVHGKGSVENIYFKDTFAAGVDYSRGTDVFVKKVLVTGYNRGNTNPIVGGINSESTISGKACIKNCVVRNASNLNGRGIRDRALQGARREIFISGCECSDMNNFGIFISSENPGSFFTAVVEDTFIHDIASQGCYLQTAIDSSGTALIKNASFSNLTNDHIAVNAFPLTSLDLKVDSCNFSLTKALVRSALFIATNGAHMDLVFENCRANNLANLVFAGTFDETVPSTQKMLIKNNRSTNMSLALLFAQNTSVAGILPTVEAILKGNSHVGARGILLLPRTWNVLDITMEHNCLSGRGSNSIGLAADPGTAGNATIKAHNNSINGFVSDIYDFGSTITYQVQKNWWGPATVLCGPSMPCGAYQTCSGNLCLGPDVVVAGLGPIHADDPLSQSIQCRCSCYQKSDSPILNKQFIAAEEPQREAEMLPMPAVS